MSEFILKDLKLLWGSYDFAAQFQSTQFSISQEAPDATSFGSTSRVVAPGGLWQSTWSGTGKVEYGTSTVDEQFGALSATDKLVTVSPEGLTLTNTSYSINTIQSAYTPIQGSPGDLLTFNIEAMARDPTYRGQLNLTGAHSSITTGAGIQLGAPSAVQVCFIAAHVTAFNGTNCTIKLQSDDNSGMSTATDRVTLTQFTAIGSELGTVAGSITDDYWAVDLSGTFTSVTVQCFMGLQTV
jgi:hypothetical protein